MKKKALGIFTICLFVFACSSDSTDDSPDPIGTDFERSELLVNWADNIIVPGYQAFDTSLEELQNAFDIFNTTTDEVNLLTFRQAWLDAYLIWQRVSMFDIGPAENADYRLNMNIFPTDVTLIENNVIQGNADLSLPSNRDAKGFPALDYLISGSGDTDTDILARFNDAAEGLQLFAYTEALINDMIAFTSGVLTEWTGSFRDAFVANNGSSVNASVDRLVNDYIFYYEFPLRRAKVGLPAGAFGNVPTDELLEAFYIGGDISNELTIQALEAVQDFFNGISFNGNSNGIGLDDYLNALDAENNDGISLATIINNQYNAATNIVEGLSSFQEELEVNPPVDLLLAVEELNRVIPLIKTDMLSFLNINVDFQDNDGD